MLKELFSSLELVCEFRFWFSSRFLGLLLGNCFFGGKVVGKSVSNFVAPPVESPVYPPVFKFERFVSSKTVRLENCEDWGVVASHHREMVDHHSREHRPPFCIA